MSASAVKVSAYTQVNVETASQGKLIVMLFNGAIKRAEEAKRQMERGGMENVHNNLIRAQDIIAELRGALNMNVGEIAGSLDRIYEYLQHLLVVANIKKSTEPIKECIVLMTQVRDMWQELFDSLAREGYERHEPSINPHGASVFNMQG